MIRIAHLSDLHFAQTTYDLSQFCSKRWLGNLNFLLFRQHTYKADHLWMLPDFLRTLHVDGICVTGDLATTSLPEEFAQGKKWMEQLPKPFFVLPGNHDMYTRSSEREKLFYRYFPERALEEKRVTVHPLKEKWWWVGLDCAVATSIFFSDGTFFKETEVALNQILAKIPSDEHVIMGNHFPLFGHGNPRHDLKRRRHLQALLKKYPQVKLYLHGHDHGFYLIDRVQEGLPLVLNSGSCAHARKGTFYLIEMDGKGCQVQQATLEENSTTWRLGEGRQYLFRHF